MSYILDALKKSEDERTQQEKVRRQSLQGAPSSAGRSAFLSPWLVLVFVFVVLFSLWWFWPTVSSFVYQARENTNPVADASGAANVNAANVESVQRNTESSQSSGSTEITDPMKMPLPPNNEIKELWQMPVDFQQLIPELNFSFHVYSDTPENRTIIINDRRLKEGAMVTSKVRLRMITSTGVILYAQGRFFHVDVYEQMYVPSDG